MSDSKPPPRPSSNPPAGDASEQSLSFSGFEVKDETLQKTNSN